MPLVVACCKPVVPIRFWNRLNIIVGAEKTNKDEPAAGGKVIVKTICSVVNRILVVKALLT